MGVFTDEELGRFVRDGFLPLREAFPREVADRARGLLWKKIGLSPGEPSGWTEPVRWAADDHGHGALGEAIRSPRLHAALDQIAGAGRWFPRGSVGNAPVRFPGLPPADDTGWHLDSCVPRPDGSWGVALGARTMLLLMLYSEVGPDDAPTRIRVGSHLDVPAVLEPHGQDGPAFAELYPAVVDATAARPQVLATGAPGDAFLCHPFLVHAAQAHRGTEPRFMSQTPVLLREPLAVHRPDGAYSPLETAVRQGLGA
ncbi:mitomycin antibiotics/polyketide fumonisin biosynthesis protein [Sphaerisporangium album]|uniref:Mitomycin antibiotics/polyketide fumonisin biosynthesis protein n=1 Tax=Sphaerisporangium album TaxID=509200 RepID=A0A367FB14_9ACTN|nr:phytanoyl-CoA dioxygenase family protein [Sphaerisporangium album]RCG26877.1 mitomycin antibiotics/polyketide fumonisin biosynthesis protein [Sphaerisporangium album]